MIRIVKFADGAISADPTSKAPGRGAYLCREETCLSLALKRKSLAKALQAEVPDEVADALRDELSDRFPEPEMGKE